MILGQPLHQRRRHQQQLAALTRNELSSHPGSVLTPADDTDIPAASHELDSELIAGLSDAELAVRHSEHGGDCRVIHTIHADQLLARAGPADYRDFRWSDPEVLRDKATQSLVRATVVRRCRHSSDDPAVVRRE
jgi:hypothetical protein